MPLVLASSSPYRRELLKRLGVPFDVASPDVDETPRLAEKPPALVARLSEAKARAVSHSHPQSLIIGSDQVASNDGTTILAKPGSEERACEQLESMAGGTTTLYTGLCLMNAATGTTHRHVETTRIAFRALSRAQIGNYVRRDHPLDCAGSFRVEGLGVALMRRIDGEDPNAIVGLPLMRLVEFLELEGVDVLGGP